jgi:hypothetical protein
MPSEGRPRRFLPGAHLMGHVELKKAIGSRHLPWYAASERTLGAKGVLEQP